MSRLVTGEGWAWLLIGWVVEVLVALPEDFFADLPRRSVEAAESAVVRVAWFEVGVQPVETDVVPVDLGVEAPTTGDSNALAPWASPSFMGERDSFLEFESLQDACLEDDWDVLGSIDCRLATFVLRSQPSIMGKLTLCLSDLKGFEGFCDFFSSIRLLAFSGRISFRQCGIFVRILALE